MSYKDAAARAAQRGTDAGVSARRLYSSILESQHAAPGQITQSRPNVDPQQQSASSLLSFNSSPRLAIATVTDSTTLANCYRLQFEKGKQPITGFLLSHTCISAFGPRDFTTIQPGQSVLAMVHDHLPFGIILGVLPSPDIEARTAVASVLLGATRNRVDEAHKKPIRMHATGNIGNWTSGRPFDITTGGETGWITETGIRVAVDSFLAQIGVDESCGLFAFMHDQLLRIAGYNLQLWTGGMEMEGFVDEAEYAQHVGISPYPWEHMGLFESGDPRRELDPDQWQVKEPWYSKWEPKDDHQMPWHRFREFQGYLGQGGKRSIQVAPIDVGASDYASYAGGQGKVGAQYPLLFDQFNGLDGSYYLASAKRISIVKRVGLISPVRIRRPEQPEDGDTKDNYKFASKLGDGPEHTITSGPKADGDDQQMQRIAGILDMHAYIFNYAGLHPFFWHDKDWELHQEAELQWTQGQSIKFNEMGIPDLASKTILPPPSPLRVKVDHRYGEQDYFQTEAGIDWVEDGGMSIYDGWASEIRMTGGSVSIAAPGDIWLQAGRNVNTWAGYDVINRAKNSMDFTVTTHDIRFKAEQHIEMLAGNSGRGGVLIESRAVGPSYDFEKFGEEAVYGGIMLKAYKSEIINWATNVYLRTGGGDVTPGVIVLDANKGERDVVVHARALNEFVQDGVFQFFGTEGDIQKANGFQPEFCTICAPTFIGGIQLIAGHVINRGWTFSPAGHIATEFAEAYSMFVPPLQGEGLRKAYDAVAQGEELANSTLPDVGRQLYTAELDNIFYNANRPGNDDVIEKASFSLRSLAQYRTEDFKLYESRWQQMCRLSEMEMPKWEEKPVTTRGQEFYPYPGKENFEKDVFVQQDLTIFEMPEGRSSNRGDDAELSSQYKEPKYGEQTPVKLDQYTVIR